VNVEEIPPGPQRRRLIPLLHLAEDSDSQLEAAIDDGVMYAVVSDDVEQVSEDSEHIGVVLALPHAPDEVELRYVAVAASQQRKGIGKAMLAHVADAIRAMGAKRILVGTSSADTGNLDFYQRCGFRLHSIERDYFSPTRGYPADFVLNGLPAVDMVWMDMQL
jgi:ribosomal protein S18 acetylase RimI-like enzyme